MGRTDSVGIVRIERFTTVVEPTYGIAEGEVDGEPDARCSTEIQHAPTSTDTVFTAHTHLCQSRPARRTIAGTGELKSSGLPFARCSANGVR